MKTGRCACGSVTFKVVTPDTYGACHCEMCRRWTGGVWMGVVCDEVVEIKGPVSEWKSSKVFEGSACARHSPDAGEHRDEVHGDGRLRPRSDTGQTASALCFSGRTSLAD